MNTSQTTEALVARAFHAAITAASTVECEARLLAQAMAEVERRRELADAATKAAREAQQQVYEAIVEAEGREYFLASKRDIVAEVEASGAFADLIAERNAAHFDAAAAYRAALDSRVSAEIASAYLAG